MSIISPIRQRLRFVVCIAAALACGHARAAMVLSSPDCSVAANSLDCRLSVILHFLYIVAAVLGVLLLLVIVLAVRSYRSKEKEDELNLP